MLKFLIEYKRKIDKSAKTHTKNKCWHSKRHKYYCSVSLSENKLRYPVENMISPSKCHDEVITTSLFHNFENSWWKINENIF